MYCWCCWSMLKLLYHRHTVPILRFLLPLWQWQNNCEGGSVLQATYGRCFCQEKLYKKRYSWTEMASHLGILRWAVHFCFNILQSFYIRFSHKLSQWVNHLGCSNFAPWSLSSSFFASAFQQRRTFKVLECFIKTRDQEILGMQPRSCLKTRHPHGVDLQGFPPSWASLDSLQLLVNLIFFELYTVLSFSSK